MEKLKIGITCYPSLGGSGVVATELAKLLAERGHEIHIITSSRPFRLNKHYPNIFYHPVEVSSYAVFQYLPYDIALANRMSEVILKEKLNVLHVHYAVPHAVCAVLAKDMSGVDVGIVTTLHGTDITVLGHDPALNGSIKYAINKSSATTSVSNALAIDTMRLIEPKKEIETIYNFVDERVYRKRSADYLYDELGLSRDEKLVIHVSNFRKVKRISDIVETFHKIRKRTKAKLLLAGDGPELPTAIEAVELAGIQEDVMFLGKRDDLPELYSISHLKLLLSEQESFGLVLLEAMSCGVPCVGTAIGGIPEVIEHGVNGYVAPLGDTDTASAYALRILEDEGLHRRFSEEAMRSVRERFNSEQIVDQYEALYQKVAYYY
ncbi:N-acetyl-alpha-D-glucosaminyl L-malate synthase BshA [Chungangia koreensis]|uniref:N-acetyl-alpha-D-glucosaminyl L-malate synthase BshA n=1 Tax=Chungangia koreensis TaxID=752657 RepID=A0ABV8X6L3_9LACT